MLEPKRGAPVVYLQEHQIDPIVEGFGLVFSMRRVAGHAGVSAYHLKKWMIEGEQDHTNDIPSLNAQLFIRVAKRLSEKAQKYLEKLEKCPDNAHCLTWLLEKCLRQDYGQDSEEAKELMELYERLAESVQRLQEVQTRVNGNAEKESVDA